MNYVNKSAGTIEISAPIVRDAWRPARSDASSATPGPCPRFHQTAGFSWSDSRVGKSDCVYEPCSIVAGDSLCERISKSGVVGT